MKGIPKSHHLPALIKEVLVKISDLEDTKYCSCTLTQKSFNLKTPCLDFNELMCIWYCLVTTYGTALLVKAFGTALLLHEDCLVTAYGTAL
jgi:hypothetical protein